MKNPCGLILAGVFVCGICQAQPTQLGIDRSAKIARIQLQGEAYRLYTLSSCDLSSTNWNFLATFNLGDTPQTWFDSASAVVPRRYYRAVKLPAFTVPEGGRLPVD